MEYEITQPPFSLAFQEMSKREFRDYYAWFLQNIPERIEILARAVPSTPGCEKWEPDCSPESLGPLGDWFAAQADTRPRTQEELEKAPDRCPFPTNIQDRVLTNKTFSLAMDIGMYLSQVLLRRHPPLQWDQRLSGKRHADYTGSPCWWASGGRCPSIRSR